MSKIITIEELYQLEGYKKDGFGFPHPKDIIPKFIDIIKQISPSYDINIIVDREGGVITKDNINIKSYGRGIVTANLNQLVKDRSIVLMPTVGIIWAFDIVKPYVKMFSGVNATACTNLCIFMADDIKVKYLNKPRVLDKDGDRKWDRTCRDVVDDILYNIEDEIQLIKSKLEKYLHIYDLLTRTEISGDDVEKLIGTMYINEVIRGNFDYSTFNEGCRIVFDDNYHHPNKKLYQLNSFLDEEETVIPVLNLWKFYGALTQRITDGAVEINDIPDKTLHIGKVILKYLTELTGINPTSEQPVPIKEEDEESL